MILGSLVPQQAWLLAFSDNPSMFVFFLSLDAQC